MHAERFQNIDAQKIDERLARDFFDDLANNHVSGVAILPARPGIEIERLLGPAIKDTGGGGIARHPGRHVVERIEIFETRSVRKQLAQRHFPGTRELWKVARNRVVQGEFVLLLERSTAVAANCLLLDATLKRMPGVAAVFGLSFASP